MCGGCIGDVADVCVFWAYAAMRGTVTHATEMVDMGKIPLIFDLDETLVLAHTIFSLKNRSLQLASEMEAAKKEPVVCADTTDRCVSNVLRAVIWSEKCDAADSRNGRRRKRC